MMWLLFFHFAFAGQLFVLQEGERRFINLKNHEHVFIPQNSHIRLHDFGSRLEVTAMKRGQINARIGESQYKILILPHAVVREGDLLALKGLDFQWEGDHLKIKGELWRFQDWIRLANLLEGVPYYFQAKMEKEVLDHARHFLFSEFRKIGLPPAIMQWDPSQPFTLTFANDTQKLQATNLTKKFGLEFVEANKGISLEPLVRLHVMLAEVSHTFLQEVGVDWQNNYQAQLLPQFRDEGGLLAQLKNLETNGKAQVLASPNLVCRSGGSAEFMAGGEFPIRMQTLRHQEVSWKKHGVLLQFKPQADHTGHMSLQMTIEVSLIDPSQMIDGVPGLKTNRIESQLNFIGSKTIILSGLIKNQLGSHSQEFFPFQKIPILGELFKSKNFIDQRTELVVFVTPYLESLEGPAEIPKLPKGFENHERYSEL